MRIRRGALAVVLVAVVAAVGYIIGSQHKLIAKIDPPSPSSFEPALVRRGANLAAIGNCDLCHTATGGADYAGNRPIPTPFGTVYSTNITPAPGSGIGRWSEAAFRRALREGISRGGRHLYPAFPYDHYARLSDADIQALYAFMMTRPSVETYEPSNALPFPLGQRWLLAFWNLLFLDSAPFAPDPQHDAEWNRGAYLVAGLGHCGDCHTPRNWLGAEKTGEALTGGEGEGWTAPALTAASPAPVPWDAAHLFRYLRQGADPAHGASAGPMRPITEALAQADESDVRAMAAYLAAQQGAVSPQRRRQVETARARAEQGERPTSQPGETAGAVLFAGACAVCHVSGAAMVPPHGIDLALSSVVNADDPRDAILIVLDGIRPSDERPGPMMPGFAGAFTDAQLASLLAYARSHYGRGPAWPDLAAKVRDVRQAGGGS